MQEGVLSVCALCDEGADFCLQVKGRALVDIAYHMNCGAWYDGKRLSNIEVGIVDLLAGVVINSSSAGERAVEPDMLNEPAVRFECQALISVVYC